MIETRIKRIKQRFEGDKFVYLHHYYSYCRGSLGLTKTEARDLLYDLERREKIKLKDFRGFWWCE